MQLCSAPRTTFPSAQGWWSPSEECLPSWPRHSVPCPASHWVQNYLSPLEVNPGGFTGSNLSSQRLWEARELLCLSQMGNWAAEKLRSNHSVLVSDLLSDSLGAVLIFFINLFWFSWCLVLLLITCVLGAQGCRSGSWGCETHSSERLFHHTKLLPASCLLGRDRIQFSRLVSSCLNGWYGYFSWWLASCPLSSIRWNQKAPYLPSNPAWSPAREGRSASARGEGWFLSTHALKYLE